MATRIFDRETLLDLTVNIVPLAIMAFFVVVFLVVNPWGVDPLASGIQFALLLAPFVLLAILTYLSGKAIAGDEKRAPVYVPGQATIPGAKPIHGDETAESAETETGALEAGEDGVDGDAEGETADGTDGADGRAADPEPTTED
jgi:hypothetical protein